MVSYSFQNVPNNIFCHYNNYHKSIVIFFIFNSQFRVPTYIERSYSLVCVYDPHVLQSETIVAVVIIRQ